jgi:hypothetical protein
MNVFDFLTLLWRALRGQTGGPDFILVYDALGAIIWAFLLFKVFITEGLNIASGNKTELPRILVKYLFVAGMFAIWPMASNHVFSAVAALADMFFPDVSTLLAQLANSMELMRSSEQAAARELGLLSMIMGTIQNLTAGIIFSAIGMIVLFLCYMLILLCVMGSLTILAMNLLLGPVFFALAFDKDFRQIALHWFSAVLSYFLLIPLYGAAVTIAVAIVGATIPTELIGLSSVAQVTAQLFGPFMAVAVVFSVNKVVNTLVGGAAGSGLASSVIGVAGIAASFIPGVAMIRSTAAAGQAAVSKLSTTARAAMGRGRS